jgi:hypothetical protein
VKKGQAERNVYKEVHVRYRCAHQGVAHFNKEGKRLTTVSAVVDAWAHGGLTIKEPGKEETIQEWSKAS